MPEKQVTIHYGEDGTVDIAKFTEDEHLSKVKQLVDGLRGSVDDQKVKIGKYAELGTPEELATVKRQAEEAAALRDRITELEGKTRMTDEERREFDQLKTKAEQFGDLDPEAARKAIDYQQRREREDALSTAFEAAGLNGKAALRLEGIRDLETRVDTETVDGKPVKSAKVKVGEEWKPLDEHVQAEYADFVPVLKPSGDQGDKGKGNGGGSTPVDGVRGTGTPKSEPEDLGSAIEQFYSQ